MDWQVMAVLFLVAASVAYLVRRWFRSRRLAVQGEARCACCSGGCAARELKKTSQPPYDG